MLDKGIEKKWLIKSENKILGPFHFDQIEELLKKKQISLIDEVRDMDTRWLYIRENPVFKSVVAEIRKEIDSKNESTKTYQTGSKTQSDLAQKTNADIPNFTAVEVREASFVEEIQQPSASLPTESRQARQEKAKIYGLPQDKYFQQKVERSTKKIVIAIGVIFAITAGGFYTHLHIQKRNLLSLESNMLTQIKKYEFMGMKKKVVELYGKMPEKNQKRALPEVLSIYPELESNQLVQLREIDRLATMPELSIQQKAYIQLIYFYNAMTSQNLKLASESIIKARAVQPSLPLALEGKALVDLKQNDFQASYETYLNLYKDNSEGRYLVGCLQALNGMAQTVRSKYTEQLSKLIESHTSVYYDYRKELLLGQMALSAWLKKDVLFKVSWQQFLNTPIQFSSLFQKPSLVPPQAYLWKDLEEYRIAVRPLLSPEELVQFEIHSYLESNQISAANQYARNNINKIKERTMKGQINLLILSSQGRSNEILALEKTGQLDANSEINHLVLALNKLETGSQDIESHINYFRENKLVFYQDWISLMQLIETKQVAGIKSFLRDHFVTISNFSPVLEAKSLVE